MAQSWHNQSIKKVETQKAFSFCIKEEKKKGKKKKKKKKKENRSLLYLAFLHVVIYTFNSQINKKYFFKPKSIIFMIFATSTHYQI